MKQDSISRRKFIRNSSATLALAAFQADRVSFLRSLAPRRVALIGSGWYGTSDLLRLIQVAPVEVVAVCDVDKNQLNKAIQRVSERQSNRKKSLGYTDYRRLLSEQK